MRDAEAEKEIQKTSAEGDDIGEGSGAISNEGSGAIASDGVTESAGEGTTNSEGMNDGMDGTSVPKGGKTEGKTESDIGEREGPKDGNSP